MLDLQLSDFAIADQVKETVSIVRSAPGISYNANDPTTFTTIASNIEVVLLGNLAPQTILPTGEVIANPPYTCDLYVPNTNIREGDIVVSTSRRDLEVDAVFHPNNTNVMTLGLKER